MRVLVISDTHRRLANLEKLMKTVGKVDMLLHCGDVEGDESRIRALVGCQAYFVDGNCDYNGDNPFDRVLDIEGHKIFMTHGHQLCVGFTLDYVADFAKQREAELVLHGHLHIPNLTEVKGITVASPGSLSEPRQDGRKPSYIIMDVVKDKPINIEIKYI